MRTLADAHIEFRQKFAAAWSLKVDDLTDLHGRIEDALSQVSKLVTSAHHHDVAKKAGRPQNWRGMEIADFKLKAPMLLLDANAPSAHLVPLASFKRSICALHTSLAGSDAGLGESAADAAIEYAGGGTALSKAD
eukprot:5192192-Pyramimonas_sp.AAC.1